MNLPLPCPGQIKSALTIEQDFQIWLLTMPRRSLACIVQDNLDRTVQEFGKQTKARLGS